MSDGIKLNVTVKSFKELTCFLNYSVVVQKDREVSCNCTTMNVSFCN